MGTILNGKSKMYLLGYILKRKRKNSTNLIRKRTMPKWEKSVQNSTTGKCHRQPH